MAWDPTKNAAQQEDIEDNHFWLAPLIKNCPDAIPGHKFIGDALIQLDEWLGHTLLTVPASIAGDESEAAQKQSRKIRVQQAVHGGKN